MNIASGASKFGLAFVGFFTLLGLAAFVMFLPVMCGGAKSSASMRTPDDAASSAAEVMRDSTGK